MKGLKTYLTFLHRNKLFTVVNVAGLSISLMFVLLIADMVTRQLSVDKNLKDTDRISVFASENTAAGHYLLGEKLQSRYPEIEEGALIPEISEYRPASTKTLPKFVHSSPERTFFSSSAINWQKEIRHKYW